MVASKKRMAQKHQGVLDRFVAACQADERVVSAFLGGSHATGTADSYSDLDLYLITTDEAYEDFLAGRETFIRLLGEPLFLEDFGTAGGHGSRYSKSPSGRGRAIGDTLGAPVKLWHSGSCPDTVSIRRQQA